MHCFEVGNQGPIYCYFSPYDAAGNPQTEIGVTLTRSIFSPYPREFIRAMAVAPGNRLIIAVEHFLDFDPDPVSVTLEEVSGDPIACGGASSCRLQRFDFSSVGYDRVVDFDLDPRTGTIEIAVKAGASVFLPPALFRFNLDGDLTGLGPLPPDVSSFSSTR
jgi:hypothetical protein